MFEARDNHKITTHISLYRSYLTSSSCWNSETMDISSESRGLRQEIKVQYLDLSSTKGDQIIKNQVQRKVLQVSKYKAFSTIEISDFLMSWLNRNKRKS